MLAAVWILSIGVGQMPWSNDSLLDVKAKCYGPNPRWTRVAGEEDTEAIDAWLSELRQKPIRVDSKDSGTSDRDGIPWERLRILATGRIAAHCVGIQDVETVGQFRQRFEDLRAIDPNLASPILRYDEIVLDLQESFQQSAEDIAWLREDARRHGFVIYRQSFSLEWYRR